MFGFIIRTFLGICKTTMTIILTQLKLNNKNKKNVIKNYVYSMQKRLKLMDYISNKFVCFHMKRKKIYNNIIQRNKRNVKTC